MTMKTVAAATALALLLGIAPADARGGRHGWGGGFGAAFPQGGFQQQGGGGWQGGGANGAAAFSREQKHSEDPYVKAASEEEERVLKKLNSICSGC